MSACWRLQTHSPIKKILNKIGDSYQTYINYYKTHTRATQYGGKGNTLMNDSEPQDINADIQDKYQADINGLENIEPDHQAGLRVWLVNLNNYSKPSMPMIMTLWMP